MAVDCTAVGRITGISSMAMRNILAELGDAHQQRSGQTVAIVSVGGVDAARRVADGEVFDLAVLAADAIQRLAAVGRVDPATRVDLARSRIAIAVAAGAPRPDIATESAIRDAVLRAHDQLFDGSGGAHLSACSSDGGIADVIAPRISSFARHSRGHPRGARRCRAGLWQLSELMHRPGIVVIGPLPTESGSPCSRQRYAPRRPTS
jgi:molybdate transport system substrate-binding protein